MTDFCNKLVDFVINWNSVKHEIREEKVSTAKTMETQITEIDELLKHWKSQIEYYETSNTDLDTKLSAVLSKVGFRKEKLTASNTLEAESLVRSMESNKNNIEDYKRKYTQFDIGKNLLQNRLDTIRNSAISSRVVQIVKNTSDAVDYERWKKDAYFLADELQEAKHKQDEVNEAMNDAHQEMIKSHSNGDELLEKYIQERPSVLMEIMSPAPPKSPLTAASSTTQTLARFELGSPNFDSKNLIHSDEELENTEEDYTQGKRFIDQAKQKLLKPLQQTMRSTSDTIRNKINQVSEL